MHPLMPLVSELVQLAGETQTVAVALSKVVFAVETGDFGTNGNVLENLE